MKIVIAASLLLLCLAGLILATRSKEDGIQASVPSVTKTVTNVPTLQVNGLKITKGVAEFTLTNYSSERLTAVWISSGRYSIAPEASYSDLTLTAAHVYTMNLDGAQPLTIEAAIYESGKSEGNRDTIQKIMDTREGYAIGLKRILSAANNDLSLVNMKAATSALNFTEQEFRSHRVYSGANYARDRTLDWLSRIERSTDQKEIDAQMQVVAQQIKQHAK